LSRYEKHIKDAGLEQLYFSAHINKNHWIAVQIPMPKVAPIIVAALPIPNNLDADELLVYGKQIIYGLLDRHIQIVSYACDGTEVERLVQRLFVEMADKTIRHVIKHPHSGGPDTEIIIGVFQGQPIVMIQDSKHGLKTFRNNLFSGARLLTLGNFTAMYRHIQELAYEAGTPLYHRDVHKLDRQDDNAAARLFSAATMEFLVKNHPEYLGEIVYLFIFGELIDAYQNRTLPHQERIKIVLRARYFMDYWQAYLESTGYSQKQYFLSREATDITRYLIDGLIGLVLVYRDHFEGHFPLFPWMHSSETCEHVFGEARQIVKDFTMLDFFYMLTKLRVKLREAILRNHSPDFKARANGYCHTYFDTKGVDRLLLSTFPTNDDIRDAAKQAMEECDSLIVLLGLDPSSLHSRVARQTPQHLPAIGSWYFNKSRNRKGCNAVGKDSTSDEVESDTDGSDDGSDDDANKLQELMDHVEKGKFSLTSEQDDALTRLSCAAMAITGDDMAKV
jgi:hypothetical protein